MSEEDIFKPEKAQFKELEKVFLIRMFVCPKCERLFEFEEAVSDGDFVQCYKCDSIYQIIDPTTKIL